MTEETLQVFENFPDGLEPSQSDKRDLGRGKELLAEGWKPHDTYGGEFLVQQGTEGKGQTRRIVHIPGLAP